MVGPLPTRKIIRTTGGMTYRQWLAGIAIHGCQLIAMESAKQDISVEGPESIARAALKQADALISELEK